MKTEEKLSLYLEILHCSHPIHLWEFDEQFQLIRSDYGEIPQSDDFIEKMKIREIILKEMHKEPRHPLLLENRFGMIFVAAFDNSEPEHVYILGPAFSGADSMSVFKEFMENSPITLAQRKAHREAMAEIPIISSTSLMQYAIVLHDLICGERLSYNDIEFYSTSDHSTRETLEQMRREHRGVYESEQNFLNLIKEGNPDYSKGVQRMLRVSSGMRLEEGNRLRNAKNNMLVLLTLISRASIEGGLDPAISYNLNDYYANRLESCTNIAETSRLAQEMMDDYVQRNRIQRKLTGISNPIKTACDYISLHLKEPLRISDLARNAGYTDYYFSHKFKEETGKSVSEYIRTAKIDAAKLYLIDSNKTINEIYEELGFGSRNSFFQSFKKETGMSPTEYRKHRGIKEED